MKYLFSLLLTLCSFIAKGQISGKVVPDPKMKIYVVEASCGQCNFALPGKGCELAIRMDGKAYFVTGTNIDDHGDAHARDGFCEAIKLAEVQGEMIGDKFNVSYFKLTEEAIQKDTDK